MFVRAETTTSSVARAGCVPVFNVRRRCRWCWRPRPSRLHVSWSTRPGRPVGPDPARHRRPGRRPCPGTLWYPLSTRRCPRSRRSSCLWWTRRTPCAIWTPWSRPRAERIGSPCSARRHKKPSKSKLLLTNRRIYRARTRQPPIIPSSVPGGGGGGTLFSYVRIHPPLVIDQTAPLLTHPRNLRRRTIFQRQVQSGASFTRYEYID